MATDPSNMTTLQDVINVLSVVFFNMNEVERVFYNVFLNPEPMDVPVQRYNDEGLLETINIPNRAKMSISILTGIGSPNGVEAANVGTFYLDTDPNARDLYFKSIGKDKDGWVKIWSNNNFREDVNYLTPDGHAPGLQDLNMDNASIGTLSVERGGTGANSLTGIVKGNGTNAFTNAVDGEDYMGPHTMTGIIAYYPTANIPNGWLKCDGAAYSSEEYPMLYAVIGTTYGSGDGATTDFNVPDLMNHFVRCWDGESEFNTVQEPQVGGHVHSLEGRNTGIESTGHTHTRGTMNITGYIGVEVDTGSVGGAFYKNSSNISKCNGTSGEINIAQVTLDASRSWIGSTSTESVSHTHPLVGNTENNNEGAENRVLNKMLVPVICYGVKRRPIRLTTEG